MGQRIVKGYWDCDYCGTKHIDGLVDECPNCVAKKRKDTKYYMMEGHIEYVTPEELKKAKISVEECDGNHEDWVCNYCDTLNNFSDVNCSSCGSPRSEASHEYGMKEIDTVSKEIFQKFDEFNNSGQTLDTLKEIKDHIVSEVGLRDRMILDELGRVPFTLYNTLGIQRKYNLTDDELLKFLERIGCTNDQICIVKKHQFESMKRDI